MNGWQMPMIVSSTDIRYRFKKIALEVNRSGMPAVVVDKSRPLVKIWPYSEDRTYSLMTPWREPEEINKTRRKLAKYVKGWDSTAAIRRMRDKSQLRGAGEKDRLSAGDGG